MKKRDWIVIVITLAILGLLVLNYYTAVVSFASDDPSLDVGFFGREFDCLWRGDVENDWTECTACCYVSWLECTNEGFPFSTGDCDNKLNVCTISCNLWRGRNCEDSCHGDYHPGSRHCDCTNSLIENCDEIYNACMGGKRIPDLARATPGVPSNPGSVPT